jgi:hypothetical protein
MVQQIPPPLHLFFTFCAVFMRISRIIITGLVVTIVLRRCHHGITALPCKSRGIVDAQLVGSCDQDTEGRDNKPT